MRISGIISKANKIGNFVKNYSPLCLNFKCNLVGFKC